MRKGRKGKGRKKKKKYLQGKVSQGAWSERNLINSIDHLNLCDPRKEKGKGRGKEEEMRNYSKIRNK